MKPKSARGTQRKPTRTSQKKKADDLFRKIIRSRGHCEAAGWDRLRCGGVLQTAHIVPRRYLSVRWDEENAYCMCAAHHTYFTYFPLAWERFRDSRLGAFYLVLRARAEAADGPPDYAAVLERLTARMKELGL